MCSNDATSRRSLLHEIGWEDLKSRRSIHKLKFYFKIVNNLTPNYLKELLPSQVSKRTPYSFLFGFYFISGVDRAF